MIAEGEKLMQLVCGEHVELALDIIVDDYEKAPELLSLEQAGLAEEQPPRQCEHCEAPAAYVVS
jgi:CxxH/CxxC protein (TIGR04129 family)